MTDLPTIAPCPWCGGKALICGSICDGQVHSYVACPNGECQVMGPESSTGEAAISAWNHVAKAVAERDELRRQVDTLRDVCNIGYSQCDMPGDRQAIRDALAATKPKKGVE